MFFCSKTSVSPDKYVPLLKISINCHFITPLPPISAYVIYEWSIQAMDATFYYIVGGMTLLAAAFGNIIILNFVS